MQARERPGSRRQATVSSIITSTSTSNIISSAGLVEQESAAPDSSNKPPVQHHPNPMHLQPAQVSFVNSLTFVCTRSASSVPPPGRTSLPSPATWSRRGRMLPTLLPNRRRGVAAGAHRGGRGLGARARRGGTAVAVRRGAVRRALGLWAEALGRPGRRRRPRGAGRARRRSGGGVAGRPGPGWPRSPARSAGRGPRLRPGALRDAWPVAGGRGRRPGRGPASGSSSRRSTTGTTGRCAVRAAGRRRAEPGGGRRRGLARAGQPAGAGPSLDAPQETLLAELGRAAGSTRSWTTRCGRPDRRALTLDTAARTGSSARRAGAGRRRVRRAAAGLVDQAVGAARAASSARRRRPSPARSPAAERARLRRHRRLPVGARGRRRDADRRRAGRAGRRSRRRWCGCAGSGSSWTRAGSRPACELAGRDGRGDRRRAAAGLGLGVDADRPDELPVAGRRPTAGSATCCPGDAERRLAPVDAPPDSSTARCGRTRSAAWPGWPSCGRLGLGGVLADDMGLGKTVQLLALLAGDVATGRPARRLLVCPMSLVGNWQREAARFTPELRVHVHHGAERARGEAFADAVGATRPGRHHLRARRPRRRRRCAEIDWRRVVVDEAQAIKNAATRQADGGPRRCPPRHRIALTGTPVENRLADLWSIMEFANPGLLGTAATFKQALRRADRAARRRRGGRAAAPVHRPVRAAPAQDRQVDHRRPAGEARDGGALQPDRRAGRALPGRGRRHAGARSRAAEGIERRGLVLATMTKLKQVCNHPAQFLRDGSRAGRPVGQAGPAGRDPRRGARRPASGRCCSPSTPSSAAMLRGHLAGAVRPRGAVPARRRRARRPATRWSPGSSPTPAAPPLFVLSLKAGGTGLNLTAANHVVHFDRWWNPAVEDQATDRAFRIGQRRDVQVRKFVCAGTVEEKIAAMITRQARAGRPDRRHRRGVADRAVHRPAARAVRARGRGGGRVSGGRRIDGWYPPSRPRRGRGRAARPAAPAGAIGASWWSRRFLDVLESFAHGQPADPRPRLRPRGPGALARRRARAW